MAHQEHLLDAEGVEEADDISDDVDGGVGGGGGRGVGVAVAAEVGCDGAVPEGGEGEQLVPPRVPQLREAVQEEHHRP